jgi:hypothetical protein
MVKVSMTPFASSRSSRERAVTREIFNFAAMLAIGSRELCRNKLNRRLSMLSCLSPFVLEEMHRHAVAAQCLGCAGGLAIRELGKIVPGLLIGLKPVVRGRFRIHLEVVRRIMTTADGACAE